MTDLQERIVGRFRWIDGHADVWRLFSDAELLRDIARALADPFRGSAIGRVAGIEARGFILAPLVAVEIGAGFAAIRKEEGLFPDPKFTRRTHPDYRGHRTLLRLQQAALLPNDRVLFVDDWVETGAHLVTAKALIESTGAHLAGVSVVVEEIAPDIRQMVPAFCALVRAADLGAGGAI